MASDESEKLKLWVICSNFGAVSERWLYRQVAGIKQFDVRVLTRKWIDPQQAPARGFQVEVASFTDRKPNKFQRFLWQLRNWRHDFFQGSPEELHWWLRRIEQDCPDVVLCHYGTSAVRLMPVLKKLPVPLVVHFHGNDMSGHLRHFRYRRQLIKSFPHLSGCVVVADYMREWLVAQGYPAARIRVIPCGTPLEDLARASHLEKQPCRFLAVGRFTEKKRPDLTLRAFAYCAQSCENVELTMVGDGELLPNCRKLAAELGVENQVNFLGPQPAERVKKEYEEAGVFVQHSVEGPDGDKEGWPVSIAEAAGSGLPIVATNHASIPTQVEHGQTGYLVAEGDWLAMGKSMITLANSPELRVRMGQASYEKISAFSTKNQIASLEAFLSEIVSQGHRPE